MWTAGDIAIALLGFVIFAGPFLVSGWMFGYGRRASLWIAVAVAAFCFWTLVLAMTRNPTDLSWATQWSIMAGLFLVPALVGAIISEIAFRRTGGE